MEKICLDFETALDFLRGDITVIEKLRNYSASEEICITSATMSQLLMAITKREAVRAFVNSVTVLPFDKAAAQITANLSHELQENGGESKRVDTLMTAAVCISNRAYLFSRTPAKFDGIKGLRKV